MDEHKNNLHDNFVEEVPHYANKSSPYSVVPAYGRSPFCFIFSTHDMNAFVESVFRDFLTDRPEPGAFVRFEPEEAGQLYGFASKMQFGPLVYSKASGQIGRTESLAVKRTSDADPESETDYYSMQFANEMHFFGRLLPLLDRATGRPSSFFPKFLYGARRATAGCDRHVIIYENLRASGYQMATEERMRKDGASEKEIALSAVFPDYHHLSLMMRKLGQFHAYSIAAAKINPNQFHLVTNFLPHMQEIFFQKHSSIFVILMKKYIRLASENPQYTSKLAPISEIADNLENSLSTVNTLRATSMAVVCHGDYTVSNLLFKYDQDGAVVDMKMLDLGLWRLSSPALDLVYLLYINADQPTRDKHWDDLMDEYFGGMADILAIDELPSRQQILEELRLHSWFAILIASFFVNSRIAPVFNLPNLSQAMAINFPHQLIANIPAEDLKKFFDNYDIGGEEANEALINIIKDMVDRKFI